MSATMADRMNIDQLSPEYLAEDIGHELIAVVSVLIVLQVIAVGARFYARRAVKVPLLLDDYLIIPALVGFVHKHGTAS